MYGVDYQGSPHLKGTILLDSWSRQHLGPFSRKKSSWNIPTMLASPKRCRRQHITKFRKRFPQLLHIADIVDIVDIVDGFHDILHTLPETNSKSPRKIRGFPFSTPLKKKLPYLWRCLNVPRKKVGISAKPYNLKEWRLYRHWLDNGWQRGCFFCQPATYPPGN